MRTGIVFFLLLLLGNTTIAQVSVSKLSIILGFERNYQHEFVGEDQYALSPELKLGGEFIKKEFEWELNFSFWHDVVDKVFNVVDAATYSYSSYIVGIRLNYFPPKKAKDTIHLISGFSLRNVLESYVGGSENDGRHRKNN